MANPGHFFQLLRHFEFCAVTLYTDRGLLPLKTSSCHNVNFVVIGDEKVPVLWKTHPAHSVKVWFMKVSRFYKSINLKSGLFIETSPGDRVSKQQTEQIKDICDSVLKTPQRPVKPYSGFRVLAHVSGDNICLNQVQVENPFQLQSCNVVPATRTTSLFLK